MSMFSNLDWRATLIVNAERAFAAGVVWAAVDGFGLIDFSAKPYEILYIFPFAFFAIGPLWWFIGKKLMEHGVQAAAFIMLAASAAIIVGDPLVWLLKKALPQAVPVEEFSVFNKVLVIAVQKPTDAEPA